MFSSCWVVLVVRLVVRLVARLVVCLVVCLVVRLLVVVVVVSWIDTDDLVGGSGGEGDVGEAPGVASSLL
jgi:hypothetical protein